MLFSRTVAELFGPRDGDFFFEISISQIVKDMSHIVNGEIMQALKAQTWPPGFINGCDLFLSSIQKLLGTRVCIHTDIPRFEPKRLL